MRALPASPVRNIDGDQREERLRKPLPVRRNLAGRRAGQQGRTNLFIHSFD